MKVKEGGQLERVGETKKLEELSFEAENSESNKICLWINQESLTYLSVDEALVLKKELTEALKNLINL